MFDYLAECLCLFWGSAYEKQNIPKSAKVLLCGGLSTEKLPFLVAEQSAVTADNGFVVIGSDGGTDICINAQGELFSVDPQGEYPVRFMNKDLNALLDFVRCIFEQSEAVINADDEDSEAIIARLRATLADIDEQAFDGDENWWAVIFEQLEQDFV